MKPLLIAALGLASVASGAVPADERARLAAERQTITQRFDQEEQACRVKFATTGCLADTRARRREALSPLRERELSLADRERQQRAQERRRAVAAKQQAAADRPAESPAPMLKLRQAPPPARSASAASPPRLVDEGARAAEAAQRAQASVLRQADIEADKKRVADRIAVRASQGKPVQPLPPLPAPRASQPGG
jgi:hypothetical protein